MSKQVSPKTIQGTIQKDFEDYLKSFSSNDNKLFSLPPNHQTSNKCEDTNLMNDNNNPLNADYINYNPALKMLEKMIFCRNGLFSQFWPFSVKRNIIDNECGASNWSNKKLMHDQNNININYFDTPKFDHENDDSFQTCLSKKSFRISPNVRAWKNNKNVYMQASNITAYIMGDQDHQKKTAKSFPKFATKRRKYGYRGSKFRGVSRNGNHWQVLIMVNKKKWYLGSYTCEEAAARSYDRAAIQNHGNKAKTNYFYTEEQIHKVMKAPQVIKLLSSLA